MKRQVYISSDDSEKFSKSNCNCTFCKSMELSKTEWKTFKSKNNLQKRMKKVIKKIEKKYK